MKNWYFLIIHFLCLLIILSADVDAQDSDKPSIVKEFTQESVIQTNAKIENHPQIPEDQAVKAAPKLNLKEDVVVKDIIFSKMPIENDNSDLNENTNLRVAKATEWNAYATIAIAILTIILALETVRLRRIQARQISELSIAAIKPKVELFIDINKYSINFLEIHIVNNGDGTANNLKFSFEADNNEAFEISKKIISKIEHINFFKIGLKHLGAGQNKKSFLMSATEREFEGNDTFFKSIIFVSVTYEDDLGKEYTSKYAINMSEFLGIRSIGGDPSKEIAESLKKISDSFTSVISFSSGTKRIQSDVYDDCSRKSEEKELKDWAEQQKII
jgi:hypothetical protein